MIQTKLISDELMQSINDIEKWKDIFLPIETSEDRNDFKPSKRSVENITKMLLQVIDETNK